MNSARCVWTKAFAAAAGICLLVLCVALRAQEQTAPKFKFDPDWPKPLPNKWKMGGVTGLSVDKDDNVWVLDRPNDLTDIELEAELTPPIADCCVRPPAMIHLDKEGNVIGSFDPPQGHGMAVDSKGFVYVGNAEHGMNTVHKYDPKTGKLVGEVPRASENEPGGGAETPTTASHVPGHGSAGPVAGFIRPAGGGGGRPQPDAATLAKREEAVAAFHAKYPPTTPMIVGQIEEVRLDEPAHEIYAADSYLGGRVMVFDMDTFKFKRGWGAYGHKLSEMTTDPKDRDYTPGGTMPKEFRGHLTLNISHDGFVYAADRMADRIHVFTKDGKFVKEFILAPMTGVGGSTGGVMFSPDKEQKILYISDLTNNHIWFLNRQDGKVLGTMGSMGENGGQFYGLHMISVDSKGIIYTGEVFGGERVQRFIPAK
jgi:DNA-binding beta-propeller fold protein YncE